MSVPLAILAMVGYAPNIEQTETVQFTIRALQGLAPASTAFVGFFLALAYPITRARHAAIWEGIAAHKAGKTAIDPITGHPIPPPALRADEEAGWFLDHFSMKELQLAMTRGTDAVRGRVLAWLGASVVVFVSTTYAVVTSLSIDKAPGLMAVLLIVGAGVSLTGVIYHAIRLRAHARLGAIATTDIRRHLLETAEQNGMPLTLETPSTAA
jgi:Na+/melibiose symporter-like transporter